MKLSVHPYLLLGPMAVALVVFLTTACAYRPSFRDASRELSQLIEPALQAGLPGIKDKLNSHSEPDRCADPILGPSDGLRPTLTYEVPLESVEDPRAFVATVEKVWRQKGLEIEVDDSERVISRYASDGRNSLRVLVSFANQAATIGGSGPCVDNPNT